jgi:hypothetical protein
MIAYNKNWLANLRLQAEVKKEFQKGHITADEFKAITAHYPSGFYTPGLFARIGLFILTCIVLSFGDGLLSLVAASSDLIETGGWFFFLGLLSYGALEFAIAQKHTYRAGIDDALLFISGCLFVTGFAILLTHSQTDYLTLSLFIFILNLWFTIRFADVLMAFLCCAALLTFIFFGWTRIAGPGLATVPFVMMLASGVLYGVGVILNKHPKLKNYENCSIVIQITGLVALYASGNYYIVQNLSDEMTGTSGRPIPFGGVFWVWTILLPMVYVAFGIRKKDVILLRTGLLLVAAAVITFRNYYHVLLIDTALTLSGILILGIAVLVTRYLKTPKYGFTSAETDDAHLMDHLKVESLVIAETFASTPAAPAGDASKFGGGDFGGGGSSDSF